LSILDLSLTPAPPKRICKACRWVETLTPDELEHFHVMELNYSCSELARALRPLGVAFCESTLRKHNLEAH
jgi:hypothetical protein